MTAERKQELRTIAAWKNNMLENYGTEQGERAARELKHYTDEYSPFTDEEWDFVRQTAIEYGLEAEAIRLSYLGDCGARSF